MGAAIGQMLASAVGIAISPLPLVAIILMLATPRGRSNGIAFTLGWVVALAVLTGAVIAAGSGGDAAAHSSGPSGWALWVKLALGVLFLLMGVKQWRGRPREGKESAPPKWMAAIDRFTPAKSAGLAAVLVAANPKNLVLAVGGALSIASTAGASAGDKAVAGVLMVVIGSLCALGPLAVYLFGGSRSTRVLGGWKAWMSAHNAAIMTTLLVVLGAKYIGDAVTGLTS
ncbi:hypothetical protein BIV57_02550 [Mangrovactinospora gilvigrisea]|uniref:GAP family protein n=1 Tax=Mangrovactinospora gilvigrisea TaxID=1428644 RepID=A0A1J7BK86_9ACTN|nr:GAP family protein [Mangrovactinospora gilvigrisea]OIV39005.1 hypothetical protein BIV57_02550 [Mangrovactinospora gilvigrisea]